MRAGPATLCGGGANFASHGARPWGGTMARGAAAGLAGRGGAGHIPVLRLPTIHAWFGLL